MKNYELYSLRNDSDPEIIPNPEMIPKSTPKLGSISSEFGRLLGKIYLFLTPSKTNRRVPSQQGAPTTCNLTYWEVFPGDITSKFGCGHRAKFSPSAEERFLTNSTYHLF